METILSLEDGTAFKGSPLGMRGNFQGRVVLNHSSFLEDFLFEPSSLDQLAVFPSPLIAQGNFSFPGKPAPCLKGLITGPFEESLSSGEDLDSFLTSLGVIGMVVENIAALAQHLEKTGWQKGEIQSSPRKI